MIIEFYGFCYDRIHKINIFKFEDVINEPVKIVNFIFEKINIDFEINIDFSEEVKKYMESFEKNKEKVSLPNKRRNKEKDKINVLTRG